MEKLKTFIKSEITGWKAWEVTWLLLACAVITGLSIYWGDTLMGIISSTTGVACVVCTGKGKLSAYVFGLVNCVLYAIISYQATLYGETMLNIVYIPLQFYGLYTWSKNMNTETNEVNKLMMTNKSRIKLSIVAFIGIIAYGYILKRLGDANPYLDSFTTVLSVLAMIISIKMYAEQWVIWVIINMASIIMWAIQLTTGNESIATLLMWIVYLFNSVVMLLKWYKEAYKNGNQI